MNRNDRRLAREAKHFTAYGIEHGTEGCRASGNHLAAQNDEPEPDVTHAGKPLSPLYASLCDLAAARDERNDAIAEAGTASEEERALARMFGGDTDDGLVLDARARGYRAGSQ